MSEDITTTPESQGGESISALLESRGFTPDVEGMQKMLGVLDTTKADLGTHKTRAADVSAMQTELDRLKAAESDRLDAERTELERVQAQVDALTQKVADANAATVAAQNGALLERVLSGKLAGLDESVRPIARRLYAAAAGAGFADEDALNELLTPVDEELKALQPSENGGARLTMSNTTSPGQNQAQMPEAVQTYLNMSQGEIREQLRRKG